MIFSSCDQVQMKLTQLELNTSKLATNGECLGKRERETEREREKYIGGCSVNFACRIPYSRKIWWRIKFGSLAVYIITAKLKSAKNFLLAYIRMAILYRTAKFKSANILAIAILGSTAKFNSRQYFQLHVYSNN